MTLGNLESTLFARPGKEAVAFCGQPLQIQSVLCLASVAKGSFGGCCEIGADRVAAAGIAVEHVVDQGSSCNDRPPEAKVLVEDLGVAKHGTKRV